MSELQEIELEIASSIALATLAPRFAWQIVQVQV